MVCLKLYTIEKVASALEITQRSVYSFIKKGMLDAVKIGKCWMVKHIDLKNFIGKGTSSR